MSKDNMERNERPISPSKMPHPLQKVKSGDHFWPAMWHYGGQGEDGGEIIESIADSCGYYISCDIIRGCDSCMDVIKKCNGKIKKWNPKPPQGEGWELVARFEDESGDWVAWFARKKAK